MTDRYAVIGNPIGHTRSPMIHAAFARQTGQDIEYGAIEGGSFAADADAFRARGGHGLNVTAPFKLDAFAYATALQDGARLAGAVNCLRFDGGTATGANFDGIGLLADIQHNLAIPVAGRRVLLLGAGGATRGALLPLLGQAPAELVVANRTVAKADALVAAFACHGRLVACGFDQLAQRPHPFDLVLNATSASLHGEMPPLPASVFGPDCLAYDLAYGQGLTPFLRCARQSGVRRLADGVGMLVEQAAEAFAWWRGIRPDTQPIIRTLTVPLV